MGGRIQRKNSFKLPVVTSPDWGKLGPGLGYGIGCGVGIGVGIVGGAGFGWGFPGFQAGLGIGAGCGIGVGYGYGAGKGRGYDQLGSYSNIGGGGGGRIKRRIYNQRSEKNPLAETELGRMIGDIFEEVVQVVASLGRRDP